MKIWKGLFGLGAAAGAALLTLKVAKKYEDNRLAEAASAAAGEEPSEEPARGMLGDIARAAGDVFSEAGAKLREVVGGIPDMETDEEAEEDEWIVYPDGYEYEKAEAENAPEAEAEAEPVPAMEDVPEDDLLDHVREAVAAAESAETESAEEPAEEEKPAE